MEIQIEDSFSKGIHKGGDFNENAEPYIASAGKFAVESGKFIRNYWPQMLLSAVVAGIGLELAGVETNLPLRVVPE